MLELGDAAAAEHDAIGAMLAQPLIDLVVLIGQHMPRAAAALAGTNVDVHTFAEFTDDLPARVAALLRAGDLVLLKASRGLRFERIMEAIRKTEEQKSRKAEKQKSRK